MSKRKSQLMRLEVRFAWVPTGVDDPKRKGSIKTIWLKEYVQKSVFSKYAHRWILTECYLLTEIPDDILRSFVKSLTEHPWYHSIVISDIDREKICAEHERRLTR